MINEVLTKEKGLIWLDIVAPSHDELSGVAERFGLHSTSLEDCLDPKHQPKFEQISDVTFIITRAYDEDCRPETDDILKITRKVAVFIGKDFFITVHRCQMPFLEELKVKWQGKAENNQVNRDILLFDLLKAVVLSFAPALEQLELSIEDFEKRLFDGESTPVIIQEIHWFRARVSAIRRIFRQSYDVILINGDDYEKVDPLYQDVRERLERFVSLTDALREASNDILNTHISLATHRTNEVIRLLTIFSVLFLPLTFIVGIYGMNFKYMPELAWKYSYPATWLAMLLITLGTYLWFKAKGWLK